MLYRIIRWKCTNTTQRALYVQCTYIVRTVGTMYVHCTYSARWAVGKICNETITEHGYRYVNVNN